MKRRWPGWLRWPGWRRWNPLSTAAVLGVLVSVPIAATWCFITHSLWEGLVAAGVAAGIAALWWYRWPFIPAELRDGAVDYREVGAKVTAQGPRPSYQLRIAVPGETGDEAMVATLHRAIQELAHDYADAGEMTVEAYWEGDRTRTQEPRATATWVRETGKVRVGEMERVDVPRAQPPGDLSTLAALRDPGIEEQVARTRPLVMALLVVVFAFVVFDVSARLAAGGGRFGLLWRAIAAFGAPALMALAPDVARLRRGRASILLDIVVAAVLGALSVLFSTHHWWSLRPVRTIALSPSAPLDFALRALIFWAWLQVLHWLAAGWRKWRYGGPV